MLPLFTPLSSYAAPLFVLDDTLVNFQKWSNSSPTVKSVNSFFHILIYIEQSDAKCYINDVQLPLIPQQVIWTHSFTKLSFGNAASLNGRVICFEDAFFSRTAQPKKYLWKLISASVQCPAISVSKQGMIFDYLKLQWNMFTRQYQTENENLLKYDFLQNILANIVLMINRQLAEDNVYIDFGGAQRNTRYFIELLQEYGTREFELDFYATKMNVSRDFLNDICHQTLAVDAAKLIEAKRLSEAKRLLIFENKSANEVSPLLGFKQTEDFSYFFHQQMNSQPLALMNHINRLFR